MCFWFFTICSVAAAAVLMPFNIKVHGSVDSEPDDPDNSTASALFHGGLRSLVNSSPILAAPGQPTNGTVPPTLIELLTDPTTSLSLHLLFTYLFSLLALYTLWRAFNHFLLTRQLFSLELVHSVSSRTVLVQAIPRHLRGERALADYFERLGWGVESVSCVRQIGGLSDLLNKRTAALLELERAWVEFVGNPATIDSGLFHKSSAPSPSGSPGQDATPTDLAPLLATLEIPGRRRPQIRIGGNRWAPWRPFVDKIGYWEGEFARWDERVKEIRKAGRFEASGAAFVTMESMADAVRRVSACVSLGRPTQLTSGPAILQQIAAQVIHSSRPEECLTSQAPEPRDVVWSNVGKSESNRWVRDWIIMGIMAVLLLTWLGA